VGEALAWGLVAASSLVVGGLIATYVRISPRTLALIMAFGAGVLLSAVAFELVQQAIETAGGIRSMAIGLFAGSATFFVGDALIDRMGGRDRKRSAGIRDDSRGLAIVLGTVLDGVPESIVLGMTLIGGGQIGITMLAAIFLSNLPEAIAATSGLRAGAEPWSRARVLRLWVLVTVVSGLASAAGYGFFGDVSPDLVAFVLGFAGGALLTMLADTLMPEAYENGGPLVGVVTTFGFATAVAIDAFS
jgi:zinc transporter, ZIP family